MFEKSETGSHFNHHNWKIGKVMRRGKGKCKKFHSILGIVRNGKMKTNNSKIGIRNSVHVELRMEGKLKIC